MLGLGLESPYADRIADWVERGRRSRRRPRTRSPRGCQCGDYFEIRNQALIAHATQVDPDGGWFAVPAEVQRVAWPTEDYHLARSLVDAETAGGRPVRRDPGEGEPVMDLAAAAAANSSSVWAPAGHARFPGRVRDGRHPVLRVPVAVQAPAQDQRGGEGSRLHRPTAALADSARSVAGQDSVGPAPFGK